MMGEMLQVPCQNEEGQKHSCDMLYHSGAKELASPLGLDGMMDGLHVEGTKRALVLHCSLFLKGTSGS